MNVRTPRIPRTAGALLAASASLAALATLGPLASGAQAAATLPTVTTAGAKQVSYGSATLDGSVDPKGSNTSYYFQYGPTSAYGGQSTIADAGAGTGTVNRNWQGPGSFRHVTSSKAALLGGKCTVRCGPGNTGIAVRPP